MQKLIVLNFSVNSSDSRQNKETRKDILELRITEHLEIRPCFTQLRVIKFWLNKYITPEPVNRGGSQLKRHFSEIRSKRS